MRNLQLSLWITKRRKRAVNLNQLYVAWGYNLCYYFALHKAQFIIAVAVVFLSHLHYFFKQQYL